MPSRAGHVRPRRRLVAAHDFVPAPPPPLTPPAPVYGLYHAAADHVTGKETLHGRVVSGLQYPFIDVASGVTTSAHAVSVEWRLDAPTTSPGVVRANVPYFDYGGITVGGPVAWDTNTVQGTTTSPVAHILTATVTLSDGSIQVLSATVSVQNPVTTGMYHTLADVLFDFTGAPSRTDAPWAPLFGAHIKIPINAPVGWDWRLGVRHFTHAGPYSNVWWYLSDPEGGGGLHDCRAQFRKYRFSKAVLGGGGVPTYQQMFASNTTANNGQYAYTADMGAPGAGMLGNFAAQMRAESVAMGGGYSISMGPLGGTISGKPVDAAHGWPDYPANFDIQNALLIYSTVQCRLIHDVAQNADLAAADLYISMGTDRFTSPTTGNVGGPTQTRFQKLDYQGHGPYDGWNTYTVATLTPAGCTFMGIPTNPTPTQLAGAIKAFLLAYPPTLDTFNP